MAIISHTLTSEHYLVSYTVGPNQSGIRLDRYIKGFYRKRSREQIKKAIDEGAITIQREQGAHLSVGKMKASLQVVAGDVVLVKSERKPEPEVSFDYKILHQDTVLFVISKPANLPVHPSGRYFFNTLTVHLKTESEKNPLKAEEFYFLAHRIDKETSGVLVLAKDKESCAHLAKQFAQRSTEKKYLALVHGITPDEFEVNLPMGRSKTSIVGLKMACIPLEEGGAPAATKFKRIETAGHFSLVECMPKTGRQHQIRVHLESAGHPIVGDKLYGVPETDSVRMYDRQYISPELEARLMLPRHALHAAGISFVHPFTGKKVEYAAPLPQDIQDFIERERNPATAFSPELYAKLRAGPTFGQIQLHSQPESTNEADESERAVGLDSDLSSEFESEDLDISSD